MTNAAIYARISNDPEGRELGVQRQEQDCRALAERLGYDVVRLFVDNDVSASTNSSKPRPEYEAMLTAVDTGAADVILAYSNSRLTRRPREWLDLIDRASRGRLQVHTVVSGSHNLSTADGRAVALTIAAWAAAEAERTAERVRAAKAQAASQGRYRGGRRPFGYEADGVTVRQVEADLVRRATREVLAGHSLAAVAREWTAAGFVGTSGSSFDAKSVRAVLSRPRNAGLLDVRGEIVGSGSWPPIVPEFEWRALVALLGDPRRRSTPGPERRWLGSGVYRCGVCDGPMVVTGSKGRKIYRCRTSNAHVTRHQPPVDEAVIAVVKAYLNDERIRERLRPRADDQGTQADRQRGDELRAKLKVFEADYYAGEITGRQLHEATDRTETELGLIAGREAARLRGTAFEEILAASDPASAFDAAPLHRQRAIVDALVTVRIDRGRRGRPAGWQPGMPYADMESVKITGKSDLPLGA